MPPDKAAFLGRDPRETLFPSIGSTTAESSSELAQTETSIRNITAVPCRIQTRTPLFRQFLA
jgi:hypothetical protein